MAKETICIIDYGSGNLRSAEKSFQKVARDEGFDVKIIVSADPKDVLRADRIVLPGQGAFKDCMENLCAIDGMIEALNEAVLEKRKPFLGICVGMQLMATRGLEHGVTAGLGWVEGEVVPIELPKNSPLKIPHMGWNELVYLSANDEQDNRHFVLRSTSFSENFYFVHSFVFKCIHMHNVLGMVEYGGLMTAVVGRDNMIGMQFHPEKSHKAGLQLLSNFMRWAP